MSSGRFNGNPSINSVPVPGNGRLNGTSGTPTASKAARRTKHPVIFELDPSSPTSLLVKNLEEKADVRTKSSQGQWVVTTPYTAEQRHKFDRDSILYYFQCIFHCGINMKFTVTRIATEAGSIRPLKINFCNAEDAQLVFESYQKRLNKN